MSQNILQYRSSSTAITPGVTSLAFGKIAQTNISGVNRLYIGNSSNVAYEIAGDAYAKLASPALTGTPTAPTASAGTNTTQLATTAFVNTAVQRSSAGLVNKGTVDVSTTSALAAFTYDNGSSGVGATITADANGAIGTIDGVSVTTGMKILVQDETAGNAPYNGIYDVTDAGDGSNPFVLTRATNFDSSSTILPNSIVTVTQGTANGDRMFWIAGIDSAPTVGTTDIVFSEFAAGTSYTAGDGLDLTGTEFSVDVTDFVGTGLEDDGSNNIRIAAAAAGNGLSGGGGSALSVNVDDSTIEITTDALNVKAAGITETEIASSSLSSTGGLQGGSGTTLSIKPDTTTGATVCAIATAANGTGVTVDNSSILHSSNVLEVGTVDGGTF